MAIKADRDVLYLDKIRNIILVILQVKKERPLHHSGNQDRGYPCPLSGTASSGSFWHRSYSSKGSITVEASFSAVLFFLALFTLLYLFCFLEGLNRIQVCLANAVWQYEVMGRKPRTVEGVLRQSILLRWDEEEGLCFVERREKVPFIGERFMGISFYQQMKINSYKGRSMISDAAGEKEYVYLAQNGNVYHRNRECVYLNPGIRKIIYKELSGKRNRSGGKYKICRICCDEENLTGLATVYITPYGDCFHSQRGCSGLKRTIRRIALSKVGHLPPCSKCAGG